MSAALALQPETLRESRTRLALSVRGLARLSGVSTRTIRRIEDGDHVATRDVLSKLEAALQSDELTLAGARQGVKPGSREELRDVVPWELDPCAQYAVACHPDGLSLTQIGELMDLDPRTVEVVEAVALAKLRLVAKDLEQLLAPEPRPDTYVHWLLMTGAGLPVTCKAKPRDSRD